MSAPSPAKSVFSLPFAEEWRARIEAEPEPHAPLAARPRALGSGSWAEQKFGGAPLGDALPEGEKLLLGVIRMIAYRAETRMMPAVANPPGGTPRPRKRLKALFQSDADIVPEPGKGILRMRILGTAGNGADRAVAGLPGELNDMRAIFPANNLRLVYELPGPEAEQAEPGPPQILRGQDI